MQRAFAFSLGRLRAASLLISLCALLALVLLATASRALGEEPGTPDPTSSQPDAVPGELLVGFDPLASPAQERRVVNRAGGKIDERIDSVDGAVVVIKNGQTTEQVAAELAGADEIAYVEPNYIVHAFQTPNDPAFGRLWGLRNTGQLGGKAGADISAPAAWDSTTGGDVTVAVIDTGVGYRHPDLVANGWTNPLEAANGLDDDANGYTDDIHGVDFLNGDGDPVDDSGHGTHVAGIIGARGNNGIGSAGVAWNVHLMALKFLDKNGDGNTADAALAIEYAIGHGATVINASWGGKASSQTLRGAVADAADNGVLFVSAAGNEGVNADASPDYPAAFDLPNVVSVAATDRNDHLADFSNYGRRTVHLGAPGDEIYSTVPGFVNRSGYTEFSGTSMATPFVSGAAALYRSRWPGRSVGQVRAALLGSVDQLPSLVGKTTTGGRLNVAKALGFGQPAALPPAPAAAPPPLIDGTPPSRFKLLRPKYRYTSRIRAVRFKWQRSTDATGIKAYRLFVDGKKRKTLHDPDGQNGRAPRTATRLRLRGGKHRWTVRAYDYAGNSRAGTTKRHRGRSARVLFIGHK